MATEDVDDDDEHDKHKDEQNVVEGDDESGVRAQGRIDAGRQGHRHQGALAAGPLSLPAFRNTRTPAFVLERVTRTENKDRITL